jgi:imidazolonepropionase-like amidohydrolase
MRQLWAFILLPGVLPSQQAPATPPIAITRVTVIDTESGSALPDRTVLVRDGRIVSVEASRSRAPGGATVLDGRGKFLIPGLWDMHVHLSWTTSSALPVLVANGVTGVRDLGSNLTEIDDWRGRIAAGVLVGPRIVRVGPIINGRSFNRFQLAVESPEQARGIVRTLKQVGVDAIKVHRRTPRDAWLAIIDEAKKQGLRVVGHIPMTVRPEEASDAGQLIEHTETLYEGTFSADLAEEQLADSIRRYRASGAADSLFARFARNGTSVTPMLVPWRYLIDHPDTSAFADPRMRYVARSFKDAARKGPPPITAAQLPGAKRTYEEFRQTVGQMHRAGVMLLAGSDIAATRIPGFLLQEELVALVDAGLSPIEAIRAATLNSAKAMGKEQDFGSIAAGKVADLVLLDANPLDDIHNTQRISAVVLGGRLLRRVDLDGLLRLSAELASRQ